MTGPRTERVPRRRAAFGLDERRWPDPDRVEGELRAFLAERFPEVLTLPAPDRAGEAAGAGRTLALLLPAGHAAVLRVERDPGRPGPAARALAARCRALRVPHATVSSLAEGRAALRRLGVEPVPARPAPPLDAPFGGIW